MNDENGVRKVAIERKDGQVDWVDDLYDIIERTVERVRVLELRLKRVEKVVRENDLDVDDDYDD